MPSTAASVAHFVYTDDPRRLVPHKDATLRQWHAGRLLPAYDPDAARPPCELSGDQPIERPVVCYSPQQEYMDYIQMYSARRWLPILHRRKGVTDPFHGYRLMPAAEATKKVPPSWVIPCVPYHHCALAAPLVLADPHYERCVDNLVEGCMEDDSLSNKKKCPIRLHEWVKDSLRWRELVALADTRFFASLASRRHVVVFEDLHHILGVSPDGTEYKRMLECAYAHTGDDVRLTRFPSDDDAPCFLVQRERHDPVVVRCGSTYVREEEVWVHHMDAWGLGDGPPPPPAAPRTRPGLRRRVRRI